MDVSVVIVQVYSVDMTKSKLPISVNNGGKRKKVKISLIFKNRFVYLLNIFIRDIYYYIKAKIWYYSRA
jgi:hypothetical protein